MNPNDAYNLCCNYHGKRVRITDRSGRIHVGEITMVDRKNVWILPDRRYRGYGLGFGGGFGGGFGRPGFGFRRSGFGIGIALGTIIGIAIAPLIFF
ncbi:hypothetical protein [Lysinibacillus sp. fls2-241-R2A-57]|uniref:hypothetical protein n=1 Tax=Lysinibacillus sp. fls2-241-R2A-57 TaxID=3040292 RepID=UPI002556FEBE|nr:hypothetical protein [Lysinibacillus sp. fls2-241-R2A-57]